MPARASTDAMLARAGILRQESGGVDYRSFMWGGFPTGPVSPSARSRSVAPNQIDENHLRSTDIAAKQAQERFSADNPIRIQAEREYENARLTVQTKEAEIRRN